MQNNEEYLVHYGVLGMKWGVRRSPEELARARGASLNTWKTTESTRLANRTTKVAKRDAARVAKREKKYNEIAEQHGKEFANNTKAAKRYEKAKTTATVNKKLAEAEAKKLMSMTYEDMEAEKIVLGKAYASSALQTIGSYALASAIGAPIFFISVPDTDAVRTNARVDAETQQKIQDEAAARVAKEIYGKR